MNLAWVRPFLIRGRHWIVRNAPHLLMGLGTGCSISAVIFATKAAPAAKEARDEAKLLKLEGNEELTIWDTIKTCWRYFGPAAAMELLSLFCFWAAHGIDVHRQAVLAGVCSTMEQALIEYQKKVTEMIGDKSEKEIRKAIAQDHIDKNPPPQIMVVDQDLECWFYYKGYLFRNAYRRVKDIQNEVNHQLIQDLYFSELELLWKFDPEGKWIRPDRDSGQIGWTVDRLMEFDILDTHTPDHQPAFEIQILDKDRRPYEAQFGYSKAL